MVPEVLVERFNAKWKADPETGCWMWTASTVGPGGYGQIKLPGQRKQIPAHRLSYLIHRGEIPEGMEVCHRCDVRGCVNPEHLFVGTSQDNHDDMVAKDRHTRGERGAYAKLTEEQVLKILAMLKRGKSQRVIAKAFGVGQMQVSRIKRGVRWAHLNPEPSAAAPVVKASMPPKDIKQAKAMLASGVLGVNVAKFFKVSVATISRINVGKRHADI